MTFQPHYPGWLDESDFGWRARIGLITPSRGWTIDHEWPRMLPKGAFCLTTRVFLKSTTPDAMEEMGRYALEAAELLATAQVDVIAYGCTVETMLKGIEYDKNLTALIRKTTGIETVTMAGAVVDAIKALGANKIAVVSPYIGEIRTKEKAFLEACGIEVLYEEGLNITDTVGIARIPPGETYRFAKRVIAKASGSDLLLLSCGNLRTIEILAVLEDDLGIPVISSNQAMLWRAMAAMGIRGSVVGCGSLFSKQI